MSAVPSAEVGAFPRVASTAQTVSNAGWRRKVRLMLIGVDALMISVAIGFTFLLLVEPGARTVGVFDVPYVQLAPVVAALWVLTLETTDSRNHRIVGSGLAEYRRVMSASLWAFGGLALVSYVFQASFSRSLFIATLPLGIVLLLLGRWSCRRFLNSLRREGRALTPTLIIGTETHVSSLVLDLAKRSDVGYRPAGVCIVGDGSGSLPMLDGLRMHPLDAVTAAGPANKYGAVIVTDGLSNDQIRSLAWRMENRPVELMFLPRLVDVAGPRMAVGEVEGLALMHVDLPQFTGWKLILKRAFDVAVSLAALVVLAPVFAVVAALIKLDDGGPILFRQERIGLRGRPFTIHKFRTMGIDAEAKIDALIAASGGSALLFKLEDDPRITGLGKFLRKYSIDELPQFWSVLRSGMSVVGPRPQVAREVAEYSDRHHRRLLIKPGITGLWQVNGRSDLSLEDSIRLDLRYVENWSLVGDVVIILKTVGVVLRPRGAF